MKIEINIEQLQLSELAAAERELVENAIEATQNSYANYSNFHVGAAVRLADGSIVRGANQENAAFPLSLCAERVAIFSAQAHHPELAIKAVAIAARSGEKLTATPVSPCGSCRQVIREMEDRYKCDVQVLLYGTDCVYRISSIKELLPLSFVDADMK